MNKYIFVDLDNTLISAHEMWHGPPKGAKTFTFNEMYSYWARVRPGADKLLEALRAIAPVYMLTAAAKDYAHSWNDQFALGFTAENIFSREDTEPGFRLQRPQGTSYLIDDLPEPTSNSQRKINFLKDIGEVKYIQIRPYAGYSNQELTTEKIAEIVAQIV